MYQWTDIRLIVDGLDATPLVTFVSSDTSVASVAYRTRVSGHLVGNATLFLATRPVEYLNATVVVSDEPVVVQYMVSKLVSSVTWEQGYSPPATLGLSNTFRVHARLSHELVDWGDGVTCTPS